MAIIYNMQMFFKNGEKSWNLKAEASESHYKNFPNYNFYLILLFVKDKTIKFLWEIQNINAL